MKTKARSRQHKGKQKRARNSRMEKKHALATAKSINKNARVSSDML
jgi:hypothetical protein